MWSLWFNKCPKKIFLLPPTNGMTQRDCTRRCICKTMRSNPPPVWLRLKVELWSGRAANQQQSFHQAAQRQLWLQMTFTNAGVNEEWFQCKHWECPTDSTILIQVIVIMIITAFPDLPLAIKTDESAGKANQKVKKRAEESERNTTCRARVPTCFQWKPALKCAVCMMYDADWIICNVSSHS